MRRAQWFIKSFLFAVKNSIKILIENEHGVARVYCDIDMTVTTLLPGQNTTSNVVEYL